MCFSWVWRWRERIVRYDPHTNWLRVLRNITFSENISFFCTSRSTSTFVVSHSFMHIFSNSFTKPSPLLMIQFTIQLFLEDLKGVVYKRPRKDDRPPLHNPSSEASTGTPQDFLWDSSLRCLSRTIKPPDRYGFLFYIPHVSLNSISIPNSYKQPMQHKCWQVAMNEELLSFQDNHTWDLVPCPSKVKPIWQ